MKTIQKLLLTSVLAVFAFAPAQAGEVTMTGSMEIAYTNGLSGGNVGNKLGQENELSVTASTELDNGVGVAYKQSITGDNARNDSELVFSDLPTIGGSIAMTSTGTPIDAIDNVTPTAFEEANHGATTFTQVGNNDGTFGIRYKNTIPMTSIALDAMYFPQSGAGDAATDEAGSGTVHEFYNSAYEVVLSGAVPMVEGAGFKVGYASTDANKALTKDDRNEYAAALSYAYGPISVGYQKTLVDNQLRGVVGVDWTKNTIYGVAYAVNDNLSVSYQVNESYQHTAEVRGDVSQAGTQGSGIAQEAKGISVAYTMGGMKIAVVDNSFDNENYTSGQSKDYTQIVLGVAF